VGLLKKLFRGPRAGTAAEPVTSQFHESETTVEHAGSGNAPRRELVHVVLRDTMRKHGIPHDWIDCRILSVVTRTRKSGMHVQFIVRQGEERLLEYVHPFQDTFWRELEKFDPRPREWLFSIAWQFDGDVTRNAHVMAGADGWEDGDTQPPPDTQPAQGDTLPPDHNREELASDLQALYAMLPQSVAPDEKPRPK